MDRKRLVTILIGAVVVMGVIVLFIVLSVGKSVNNYPHLEFEPKPPKYEDGDTLIYDVTIDRRNISTWVERLDKFIKGYQKPERGAESLTVCESHQRPVKGKVCDFPLERISGPCSKDNSYGYHKGSPCVFLSMNKMVGWVPKYYNSSILPDVMPRDLMETIKEKEMRNQHEKIWVTCEGQHPVDVENIGPIKYYPDRGFSSEYFPEENIEGYLAPLVAVHFERPQTGVVISVICKAWSANIDIDPEKQKGMVEFELLVN